MSLSNFHCILIITQYSLYKKGQENMKRFILRDVEWKLVNIIRIYNIYIVLKHLEFGDSNIDITVGNV